MAELSPAAIARIADESALAAIVVDEDSSVRIAANNNSICEVLYGSADFAPRCDEYCGKAVEMAGDDRASYRCYAGLDCVAVRLRSEKKLVAIVGRAFTEAKNYRAATERAIEGDWNGFPPTKIFGNVLLTSSGQNIEAAANKIALLGEDMKVKAPVVEEPAIEAKPVPSDESEQSLTAVPEPEIAEAVEPEIDSKTESEPIPKPTSDLEADTISQKDAIEQMLREFGGKAVQALPISGPPTSETEELTAWRAFFGSLTTLKYRDACDSILDFLGRRYGLNSLGWLELRETGFEVVSSTGNLSGHVFRVKFSPDDERLFRAIEAEVPLFLRERRKDGERTERGSIALFPIAVGDEVQNALVVADTPADDYLNEHLSRFCRSVGPEIEILRLRGEVRRRGRQARAVERFNASLKHIDTEDFWPGLLQISSELMNAERSSLLLFDEKTESLTVRAAIGATADSIASTSEGVGERVARGVLSDGKPVVVSDVSKIGLGAAPADWKYKTGSFICYPFMIGDRRIGVLNVADRVDGASYDEFDLEVLDAIAPQVAIVLDRAEIKNRAGRFETLSVTDPLTGLLNRRYLEERLSEEIKRSNRYGYPMSFLMIDVDDFGKFNKDFGVLVGDKVLREAVNAMRSTLRGADIAARYGGEEFCVLLPQTTLTEARTIAERIRRSVEGIEFPERQITISIGISSFAFGISTAEDIINAADEAMRRAKTGGKNQVVAHESTETSEN